MRELATNESVLFLQNGGVDAKDENVAQIF